MPHTYAARIGEIDIVSARFDACARHGVVLSLERTGRVNDDVRTEPPQLRGEIRARHRAPLVRGTHYPQRPRLLHPGRRR